MKKNTNFNKLSMDDRIFVCCNNAILVLISLLVLYPIVYVISASFSDPWAILSGKVWLLPVNFNVKAYTVVFQYQKVWLGFVNSFIYMTVGTTINVIMTIFAAYPLSRKDFFGGTLWSFVFAFTMWFSGGMIPTYLLVKDLGLINSRWAMILPSALTIYNVIVTRTYFQTSIPHEIFEAARIDGCNDFKFLRGIAIPLATPVIAVIALFYAVGHWNSFMPAFLYLQDYKKFPIQIILREILIMNASDQITANLDIVDESQQLSEQLKYALIVVASLPTVILYPFAQKYFVKGVMLGAVKG